MGNTCKSMADSFQCMTKPTTIKKIKKNKGDEHQKKEKHSPPCLFHKDHFDMFCLGNFFLANTYKSIELGETATLNI